MNKLTNCSDDNLKANLRAKSITCNHTNSITSLRVREYRADTPSGSEYRTPSGGILFLSQFLLPEVAQHIIGIVMTFRVAPVSHFFRSGPSISASWPNSQGSAIAPRRARVATPRAAARPRKIVRYLPRTSLLA